MEHHEDLHLHLSPVMDHNGHVEWLLDIHNLMMAYACCPNLNETETAKSLSTRFLPSSKGQLQTFYHEFWLLLIGIVRQVPYHHSTQNRMMRLIAELVSEKWRRSESETAINWVTLPKLNWRLQDIWQEPQSDDLSEWEAWMNLNSWVARLYGNELIGEEFYPIYAMRSAFETDDHASHFRWTMRKLTAAEWAIHSAAQIYRVMRKFKVGPHDPHYYGSFVWDGPAVFSQGRWLSWKSHFESIFQTAAGHFVQEPGDVQWAAARAFEEMNTKEEEWKSSEEGSSGRNRMSGTSGSSEIIAELGETQSR